MALLYCCCLIALFMLHETNSLPFSYTISSAIPSTTIDPELASNYFEGDMNLNAAQQQILFSGRSAGSKKRNGQLNVRYRWPNKTVHYRLNQGFSHAELVHIEKAMYYIETKTCIRFVNATPTTRALVQINPGTGGCSSAVGYQGSLQFLNLRRGPINSGCFRMGTIIHELLHTLGFYHQHSAADRDNFVRIHNQNIAPGREHNFYKYAGNYVSDFGVSYDYGSVMHYNAYAFSRNGQPTIEPLDRSVSAIGQRIGLSDKDVLKINRMYKC